MARCVANHRENHQFQSKRKCHIYVTRSQDLSRGRWVVANHRIGWFEPIQDPPISVICGQEANVPLINHMPKLHLLLKFNPTGLRIVLLKSTLLVVFDGYGVTPLWSLSMLKASTFSTLVGLVMEMESSGNAKATSSQIPIHSCFLLPEKLKIKLKKKKPTHVSFKAFNFSFS